MYAKLVVSGKGDVEPEGNCWIYGMIPYFGVCLSGYYPYWPF